MLLLSLYFLLLVRKQPRPCCLNILSVEVTRTIESKRFPNKHSLLSWPLKPMNGNIIRNDKMVITLIIAAILLTHNNAIWTFQLKMTKAGKWMLSKQKNYILPVQKGGGGDRIGSLEWLPSIGQVRTLRTFCSDPSQGCISSTQHLNFWCFESSFDGDI